MKYIILALSLFITLNNRDKLIQNSLHTKVIEQNSFTVGFDTLRNIPIWTSYYLDSLNVKICQRSSITRTSFRNDPCLPNFKPLSDYVNSGYDRGHLIPAEDMQMDSLSSVQSFYVTNIIPQTPTLNRGDWKELENRCRNLALYHKRLLIISGPIYTDTVKYIGKTKVPSHCYKIIFNPKKQSVISYIMNNDSTNQDLKLYLTTVDKIECLTNIDFLSDVEDSIENKIESLKNSNL